VLKKLDDNRARILPRGSKEILKGGSMPIVICMEAHEQRALPIAHKAAQWVRHPTLVQKQAVKD